LRQSLLFGFSGKALPMTSSAAPSKEYRKRFYERPRQLCDCRVAFSMFEQAWESEILGDVMGKPLRTSEKTILKVLTSPTN
jgi:hypothetical protein